MESEKLNNLKHILKNESKVPSYCTKLLKLIEIFGQEKVFDMFMLEDNETTIEAQRHLLQRILDYISQSEDLSMVLQLLKLLIIWTSSKNNSLYKLQVKEVQNETVNFNEFKARLVIELSMLEQRFPSSLNLKQLSQHILMLANECLIAAQAQNPQVSKLTNETKEELQKIIGFYKEKMRIETSELARDVRATNDINANLMILESLQIQLSQIHSLDLQIKHFIDKLQPVFIQVCQQMIQAYEERQSHPLTQEEQQDIEEEEKEILMSMAKILETIIAQTEYLIKLKSQGPQGQDQVIVYVDKDFQRYLKKKCRKLYKAFAYGINALITRSKSYKLQSSCLRLLKRFYEIFEKHQTVLEDTILTCLQNFAEIEDVKKHKIAALFYYHLLNSFETNEQFKKKLKEDKSLDILKYNPHFSSIFFIHQIEQEQPVELNVLHIKSGFSLEQTIQPKTNFKQYIHVSKANSILHYNFTTQEYNIGFSVERVGSLKLVQGGWEELNNDEVVRYSICDSHLKPISGSVLLTKPGVYKIIWHNSYSYLKAKQLKYRLRILEKKDALDDKQSIETSSLQLEDLFTINELNENEDSVYKALKQIYPDFIPIVRIVRNSSQKPKVNQEKSLVLFIEDNRSYLRINKEEENKDSLQFSEVVQSDIYVQQLNHKELEQAEYDATKFYSDDTQFTQIYIVTELTGFQKTATNPYNSHFSMKKKSVLRDYVIRAEKILYYTLEKIHFKDKLHTNAQFYFADACDNLICADIYKAIFGQSTQKRQASLYNCGDSNLLLTMDIDKESYYAREISDLVSLSEDDSSPSKKMEQNISRRDYKEYSQMIFSYLKILYNIEGENIMIYDDDSCSELSEVEDKVLTLREEALKYAILLKDIYNIFRRGSSNQQ